MRLGKLIDDFFWFHDADELAEFKTIIRQAVRKIIRDRLTNEDDADTRDFGEKS